MKLVNLTRLFCDLVGQFTSRGDDDDSNARVVLAVPSLTFLLQSNQPLKRRNQEGCSFASTCLGLSNHVHSFKCLLQSLILDLGQKLVLADFLDCLLGEAVDAE